MLQKCYDLKIPFTCKVTNNSKVSLVNNTCVPPYQSCSSSTSLIQPVGGAVGFVYKPGLLSIRCFTATRSISQGATQKPMERVCMPAICKPTIYEPTSQSGEQAAHDGEQWRHNAPNLRVHTEKVNKRRTVQQTAPFRLYQASGISSGNKVLQFAFTMKKSHLVKRVRF